MFRPRAVTAALILSCSLGTGVAQAADPPAWVSSGTTAYSHQDAAAVALPGGESALLIGGLHWTGTTFDAQTMERYDLASNRWSTMARIPEPRRASGATVLGDGRVLVAGGWNYPGGNVATADLYSPATNTWSPAEPMDEPRSSLRLVLLDSGKVLAVGGGYSELSELYDPATGHWSAGKRTGTPRRLPAVSKLADGRVLAAGGMAPFDDSSSADLYDPATDAWTPVAPMHTARTNAVAGALPDGRVLVAGGSQSASPASLDAPGTYEIYDPTHDTWTTPAKLSRPRAADARMVTLSDGRLVITGGYNGSGLGSAFGGEQSTADVYDPQTGTWTETVPAGTSRAQHIAVALHDDSVLVAGGVFDEHASERLVFPVPPMPDPAVETPVVETPAILPTPAPAPTPVPSPVSPTRAKSILSAAQHLHAKSGVVTVKVRCAGPGTCTERLTLRVRKGRTLARTDVSLASGKARTIRLKLSKADRRRLAKRSTKVTLTLGTTKRNATLQA